MDFSGHLSVQQLQKLRAATEGSESHVDRLARTCLLFLQMTLDEAIAKRNARANQD